MKNLWFQLHWLIGITAGIILAIVGFTGGMLSFEHEIQAALNPGIMTVAPQASAPLTPAELIARTQAEHPQRRITALAISSNPKDAARITFAPKPGDTNKRGENRYLNPYTAELLGQPKGEQFFRTTMQIHRWLAAGDTGKAIVGASTIALIVLCLSGLYLRWPRKLFNWRAWLAFDFRLKGRSFLWDLHSVAGTWALLFYLLASFTGLYWSYGWYRDALFSLTGAPRPVQQARAPDGPKRERALENLQASQPDIDAVWSSFQREVPAYSNVTLRLPEKTSQPVQLTYLDADPAHERASNRLTIDARSGAVKSHERYADKPAGAKLMSSIFVLHSGSFFGLPGLVMMMIASLAMPLFAITGWMLYLDRRKKKKGVRTARSAAAPAPSSATTAPAAEWLIGFASQTGFAERLAWQTAGMLRTAGVPVTVEPLGRISSEQLGRFRNALFVVSTFGEGEAPDHARSFARLMKQSASLAGLRFGLLALGNKHYESFCGFGRRLDDWLRTHGAQALFDRVEMNNDDPHALKTWQSRLGLAAGAPVDAAEWTEAAHEPWRLVQRTLLNPGSCGGPVFHLELEPPRGAQRHWQAGDLVDIRPHHSAEATTPIADRQYSIASIPQDGTIHLVVRQIRHDGMLGLASGWLTEHAQPGSEILLRLRRNTNFHLPDNDSPLILIGNGTGIAGLRSHLKARVANGRRRNWLIFGERNAAHDYYFRNELETWRGQKMLERVDLVFSRDQADRIYVQDRLRASAEAVREWVADGAVILVCGSLEGMAPGIEAALKDILGDEAMEKLAGDGRYRRDVY